MLRIEVIDNLRCPIIVCDVCNTRIEDGGLAAYAWATDDRGQPIDGHLVCVHKGACLDRFEAENGDTIGWDELSFLPVRLAANTNIDLNKTIDILQRLPNI